MLRLSLHGFLLALFAVNCFAQQAAYKVASPEKKRKSVETLARQTLLQLPLTFEANHGQADPHVKFLSRSSGYSLLLTGSEAVLALQAKGPMEKGKPTKSSESTDFVRMKLIAANREPKVTALEKLPGVSNYFIGNDPAKWRTNVTNYAKVKY